jgi:hypothetical protein
LLFIIERVLLGLPADPIPQHGEASREAAPFD